MVLMGASFCMFDASASALTTVPTKTNFQGRLTNSAGNIMPDGLYNMKFRLFTVSSGGTDVWNETRETTNRVQVTNGLFSVRLGDVTPIPASLFASGNLYFEVELPTPGTATCSTAACASFTEGPMTPRNQMATSAYAYNSETLDGLDSVSFARTDANNLLLGTNTINVASANAFDVQNGSSVSVFKVDTSASVVTIAADTVLTAGKSLTITGGGTRPASPTEGMIYYDTSTKQLLTFANGKWQADRSDAILVAANNSSPADKAAADFLADGNTGAALDGDQVQINQALTAGSGKKVVLLAGAYTVDAGINVPNNTTLSGVGDGTVITLPNSFDTGIDVIINSDAATGTGISIRDLKLDGNASNQSSGSMEGIRLEGMGDTSTNRDGARISHLTVTSFRGNGIMLFDSYNNTVTNSRFADIMAPTASGIILDNSSNNVISNNKSSGNDTGIGLNNSSNSNTVIGNTLTSNNLGIGIGSSSYNTISGNTISDSVNPGILLSASSHNTVTSNTVRNSYVGISLLVSNTDNTIANNTIVDSGGASFNNGISVNASDNNTITSNKISDTTHTTNNYAINISNSTSDNNYLADNTLGTGSINNVGTGTVFGGQVTTSGNYTVQPAGTVELIANTNVTGTLNISSNVDSNGSLTIGTADQFVISSAGVVTAGTWQSSTQIQDAYISNTLTASIFQGSGTTTDAVDLGTAEVAGTLTVVRGGIGHATTSVGDLLIGAASNTFNKLAIGGTNTCLTSTGTTASWSACTLQTAYTNSTGSTTPEVKLDTTRGAFDIQDADSTIGASLLNIKTSSAAATLLSVGNTGVTTFQNSSDSAAAFTISRAGAGGSLFVADTTNSRVQIGNATADATGIVLVLDTKNTTGDPTGVDGATYYNSFMKSFRCYQNGVWRSCIGGLAYSNTAPAATITGTGGTGDQAFSTSHTIPAGSCQPGRVYRLTARGVYSSATIGLG